LSTAASEHHKAWTRSVTASGPAAALVGLTALLCARLVPDITGKPLHEDEAVAGLISARPLGDLLHTVVLDRGGAPLHFLLAHVALAIDTTPESLRWLSLVFALATVPLCYDLARRLAGQSAGVIAARACSDVAAAARVRDIRADVLALRVRECACGRPVRACARTAAAP